MSDDTDTPSWLDKAFLASALTGEEEGESPVTIDNFVVKPAVAAGNNYTSNLYRVAVEYRVGQSDKTESKSLIVKMPIQKGVIYEMSEQTDFFSKEPIMYNIILPKMNDLCRINFGPKSFCSPLRNSLVIQDLKPEGYILLDRLKQLDFEHCKIVVEKLGRFHATSVALYHGNPEIFETVGKELFYTHRGVMEEDMKAWLSACMKLFIKVLQEDGSEQPCIDLITARVDTLWDSIVECYQTHSDSLNVLNHGDCWSSNMLFKYDELGNVIDVMFIDYQLTRYSSPVSDLLYFVYSSADEDVRENRIQDLYDFYLETLNKSLEQLGCEDRLTRDELYKKLKSSSDCMLLIIGCVLPFIKCETEDALDMENFTTEDFVKGDDERYVKMYQSKQFRALLPVLVRQYMSLVTGQ